MFPLDGKIALVAGASRGIGLAIAQGLARTGAHTILAARSEPQLQVQAAALRQHGLSAESAPLDLTDPTSIEALANRYPEIDILVNVGGTNIRQRFQDYTPEQYQYILQTNLHGIVQLTQKIGGTMIARGKGGKIIFIGSLMSLLGLPYLTVYAMSKSALAGLTRTLAAEWGVHGIQVNCIAPGFIVTDLNREMWQSEELRRWLNGSQAMPRTGTPEDIAPLAVFLAGKGADYITGQVIAADGGYTTTARWPFDPPSS